MPLEIYQKLKFYQNTKAILDNDIFENVVRDSHDQLDNTDNTSYQDYYTFSSKDNFLSDAKCYFKHIIKEEDEISLSYGKSDAEQLFQELQIIRKKKTCTIVIGDHLLGMLEEKNIEKRITDCFAGRCARYLDTDLYVFNITNIDNTSNVFKLKKIIKKLLNQNYEKLNIIFQMVDPARCFNSLWWSPNEVAIRNSHEILKKHPSYHFTNMNMLLNFRDEKGNIEFYFDSYYFKGCKKQSQGYPILSPHEFFQMYELSILDLIKEIIVGFKNTANFNLLVWKDFFQICNKPHDNIFQQSFIEEITKKKLNLPYTSDEGKFAKDFASNYPEEEKDKWSDDSSIVDFYPKNSNEIIYHPIVNINHLTEKLFLNPVPTQYHPFKNNWKSLSINVSDHDSWSMKLLKTSGWIK